MNFVFGIYVDPMISADLLLLVSCDQWPLFMRLGGAKQHRVLCCFFWFQALYDLRKTFLFHIQRQILDALGPLLYYAGMPLKEGAIMPRHVYKVRRVKCSARNG